MQANRQLRLSPVRFLHFVLDVSMTKQLFTVSELSHYLEIESPLGYCVKFYVTGFSTHCHACQGKTKCFLSLPDGRSKQCVWFSSNSEHPAQPLSKTPTHLTKWPTQFTQ